MASSEGFQFRMFYVRHDRCAMKVGTDGVLIGCWPLADSHMPIRRILDVGTGSGLVALMMAQRFPEAHIDAIDIDEAACEQAKENAQISNFRSLISIFISRLQDWKPEAKYDLIVSNPPYFQNSLKNPDSGRKLARHTDTLSYEDLISHSVRLLSPNGMLALILPAETEAEFTEIAAKAGLALSRITRVYSKESKPARRVLLCFQWSAISMPPTEDILVLEDNKGGRSASYQELTKDFYL